MKKIVSFLISAFLLLSACSSSQANKPVTIDYIKSDEDLYQVMDILADELHIWRVTIDDEVAEEIEVSLRHFEKNLEQEPVAQFSTSLNQRSGPREISLIIAQQTFESEYKFILATIDGDTVSSIEQIVSINEPEAKGFSSISYPAVAELGQELAIGALVMTDNENSYTPSIALEEPLDPEQLTNFNHSFILTMTIK